MAPSATRIPAWPLVLTLQPDRANPILRDLYEGVEGCVLPCWWGIVPGQTTYAEAYDWLAPLGTVSRPFVTTLGIRYDIEIAVPPELEGRVYLSPGVAVREGRVIGISLNSSAISRDFDYSLAGWLQALGAPEEIWLYVMFDSMGLPHYDLHLFYPSKGIMVGGGGFTEARGDEFVICPVPFKRGNFPNAVVLWSPGLDVNYSNLMQDVFGLNTAPSIVEELPLEAWTEDFGPEEFHATYSVANTSACFEVHPPDIR